MRYSATLDGLAEIVADYVRVQRPRREAERRFYAGHATWDDLLDTVGAARDRHGRRHSHQRRLPVMALEAVRQALDAADLRDARTFERLIELVGQAMAGIHRVGELMVYDTALRLGAYLGLEPELVYLHRGTRAGAKVLGLPHTKPTLAMSELAAQLRSLRPREVEDLLCIYKTALKRPPPLA